MWMILLAGIAAAQTPPLGFEGDLSVAMPHARLGPAPGLRLLVDAEVVDSVWIGGEGDVRLPGRRQVSLNAPELTRDIDITSGQTAWALGARAAWTPGDIDGLRWRLGGAVGATRLIQSVKGDFGTTREAASTVWIRPEGGILYALGPGQLAASLYWSVAPAQLDVLDGGGSVLGILIGYRYELR